MPIPKREATAIINSLGTGVVPRIGLRHIAVGRLREIAAIKHDFDHIRDGGAIVRFVIGRFGSGKSFMLQLARSFALENKFLVADADFSSERRLHGSGGQALATYRELMKNLSTQTRPDGNALPVIIERWISSVQSEVMTKQALTIGSPEFAEAVKINIIATVNRMEELVHGFDFGTVLSAYYKGYVEGNDFLKGSAIQWLRGEFNTKTEAREALGVHSIVDDDSYYDYLKIIARFAHDIGYAGFLICLDEADKLYKIPNSITRSGNYEKVLSILNDSMQGRAGYYGFIFGGTPEFLEDQRRGLFSNEALRTRLSESKFVNNTMRDSSGPVLTLLSLTPEEIYVLLQKIRDIHQVTIPQSPRLEDEAIVAYLEESLRRIGAKEFATPRHLIRDFVSLLNLLTQYPDKSWQDIVSEVSTPTTRPSESAEFETEPQKDMTESLDRFTNFKVR